MDIQIYDVFVSNPNCLSSSRLFSGRYALAVNRVRFLQLNFTVGDVAHQQIAARLNIPFRYYKKMQDESPHLLDQNVNEWFNKNTERRMIRILDGNIRAFLSSCYRRLDNLELCAAVLPVIQEMQGAQIESCEITSTHLYLKVVNRRLKAEVRVGDVLQAGFVVSNSEVRLGSLRNGINLTEQEKNFMMVKKDYYKINPIKKLQKILKEMEGNKA